jgi:hypothetical protein
MCENGRKGQRLKSVGRLVGKLKSEKPLAYWIMTTGVDFLGPETSTWRQKEWTAMMDGDVSHLSEIKLGSFRSYVLLFVFLRCPCILLSCSLVCHILSVFYLGCLLIYQWGLIPRIGKISRSGGDYWAFVFCLFAFLVS